MVFALCPLLAAACGDDDDNGDVCGNGIIEGDEQCDQDALGGATCQSVDGQFTGGTLACSSECTFDTSQCTAGDCGNGQVDEGEDCDGSDLDGQECTDVGDYSGGTLACNQDCIFDTGECVPMDDCGNDLIDEGESCDGSNLDGTACEDLTGFVSGDLACANDCSFDTGGCLTASDLIQIAKTTTDGTGLDLKIAGAWVTYLKPAVGYDPAGFTIQADTAGPALFVAVDPESLSPIPAVGDEVSFTILQIESYGSQKQVSTIAGFNVISQGHDVSMLYQNITTATDVVTGLDDYIAEVITVSATMVGSFGFAGSGHQSADIETDGVAGGTGLVLRLPDTLVDTLPLDIGCSFSVVGTPLWRYETEAQVIAYDSSELISITCPAPEVTSAVATSETEVVIFMSRSMDPASLTDPATQITFDNGLTATGASVSGDRITVTTSAQTVLTTYTVTVDSSVTDVLGTGVDPTANQATFTGYQLIELMINEVDYDNVGADDMEFIEIYNPTAYPVPLTGLAVVLVNGNNNSEYDRIDLSSAGTLAAGGYLVLGPADLLLTVPSGVATIEFNGSIQNGSPDALGILNTATGTLLDALSYEGSVTDGVVTGVTGTLSFVEGTPTSEEDSTSTEGSLCRIPNGVDTDDAATDWSFCTTPSPGAAN